jgi:2'-5' RNA ligase
MPPPDVLDGLGELGCRLGALLPSSRLRWLPRESLHVTLRFLGDCGAETRAALEALLDATPKPSPIAAHVAGIQYLPSSSNARVLVLRIESGRVLESFAAALEAGARQVGFAPEPRSFRAHLTLARVRSGPERLAPFTAPPPRIALAIEHLALMRSQLGPSGAGYLELRRWPLAPL